MQHDYLPAGCSDSNAMMDPPDPLQLASEVASSPMKMVNQTSMTNDTNTAIGTEAEGAEPVTFMDPAMDGWRRLQSQSPQPPQTSITLHEKTGILTNNSVYMLLAQSMGTIALDCGYHQAQQAGLDVLSDVCCDYIKRISCMLRFVVDTQDWRDPECDFVDSLERVFHEINIPSVANLHQFVCKMEAIKKHDHRSS